MSKSGLIAQEKEGSNVFQATGHNPIVAKWVGLQYNSPMKEVLLSSTLHDPRGVFLNVLLNAGKVVLDGYKSWVVNVTTTTDQRVKDILYTLAPLGLVMTETDPKEPIVPDKIENDHLYLLMQAAKVAERSGINRIQYTDGDRIITAATYFPDRLQEMAQKASSLLGDKESYVNFRRSAEDYFTHHPPLVQTEFEVNRLYSAVFGMSLDTLSTAHGMSLGVVKEVLHRSPLMEVVSFPEPKWLITAKEMGVPIQSEETQNVLTFETPDQFRKEVEAEVAKGSLHKMTETGEIEPLRKTDLGNYSIMQQAYMATLGLNSTVSPKEWDLRFNTATQYLALLRNYLSIFGYDRQKEDGLRIEITRSLASLEGRRQAIIEAMGRPANPESR